VLVFNGSAIAGERTWPRAAGLLAAGEKKRARMSEDTSAKAWPMSGIPPERIDRKRRVDSFSWSEVRPVSN
jgi:hypothetical protein